MKGLLLALTALIAVTIPSLTWAAEPPYPIGVLAPLTGPFANYGATIRRAIEGVKRPEINWIFQDEGCDPAKAVTAYHRLSSVDGVKFFLGPCCGSPQKSVAPLLAKNQQLALLPNAAPASVFPLSGQRMYSAQYPIDAEAAFLAEEMHKRGLRKVAIVYVDSEFSRTIEEAFTNQFKGNIVFALRAPAFEVQYIKTALLKLKGMEFDALFVPDAAPFLLGLRTEMRRVGLASKPTFSIYSVQMPDVITAEAKNADGLLYSYPKLPEGVEALSYFPLLAAERLSDAVLACKGEVACVKERFKSDPEFDADGTLRGGIVLKTVEHGAFVHVGADNKIRRPAR